MLKDVIGCTEFTRAVAGSSLMRKMEENNMAGENEEKSQSETEKHHQRPSSTCTPCLSMQKEKRTRENTGRGEA